MNAWKYKQTFHQPINLTETYSQCRTFANLLDIIHALTSVYFIVWQEELRQYVRTKVNAYTYFYLSITFHAKSTEYRQI